jgi:uncharacterized protein YndB with AHSA1/START domain
MTRPPRKHHGRTIDTRLPIATTPMRAWEAWADPEQIANWFVDRAEGRAAPGEVMTWFFDAFGYRQSVPIVEAVAGESLVVGSGDVPGPSGLPYLMEVTIEAAEGATVVRIVNSGFREDASFDDEYEGVASGWQMALATMKRWLERHPTARRIHRIEMISVPFAAPALRRLFGTEEGRRAWLEPALPTGSAVLADTGREVLLAWDEREAVLGLKAFRMGPRPMLALDFSAWPTAPIDLDALGQELRAALERLAPLAAAR